MSEVGPSLCHIIGPAVTPGHTVIVRDLHLTNCVINNLLYPAMKGVLKVSQGRGCLLPINIIDETIHCNPVEEKITPSMQEDLEKVCQKSQLMIKLLKGHC